MNPTEAEEQIEEAESSGNYSKEVIFDKKKYQKIISKKYEDRVHRRISENLS